MQAVPITIDPPELLGEVSTPNGVLVVLDAGLMNFWCHNDEPILPAGILSSEEAEASANAAKDLQITGPDARKAGIAFDRGCHPMFLYDVPPTFVDERIAQFNQFISEQGLAAAMEVCSERVTHYHRITQHLKDGIPANGISFHGIWAAVIPGLPANTSLPVFGRRRSTGTEFEGRWHDIYIEIAPGASVVRSEMCGYAAVDEARLMFCDMDALGSWTHEESHDGLADVVFWGRDAAEAATASGAKAFKDGNFGWHDLPVAEAAAHAMRLEEIKTAREWMFALDFRPHSDHWRAMEKIRASPTESATIDLADANVCVFMTSWGDGLFEVYADRDEADRLVRVRIALGTEKRLELMRSIEERWYGAFAKLACVSRRVLEDGQCARFLTRDSTERDEDSGWSIFAGGEDDDYVNDPSNFVMMPIRELLERDPTLESPLRAPCGSTFERPTLNAPFDPVTE